VKSGCDYLNNAIVIVERIRKSLFVFIITVITQR